ncbi:MAG: creatininase family protein, partial [Gammaproteobacteria bacterium]
NRAWSGQRCRAHALPEFYGATHDAYVAALKSRGLTPAEIGQHAGVADTSLTLAIDASLVRGDALAKAGKPVAGDGIDGDPRKSTRALGEIGVARIVDASVAALQRALGQH